MHQLQRPDRDRKRHYAPHWLHVQSNDTAQRALTTGACSRASDVPRARRGRHDYGVRNYVAAARHLAALQADGLVRHVGVTNFDVPRLREMLDAGVRIISNQVGGRPALALAQVIRAQRAALLLCLLPLN